MGRTPVACTLKPAGLADRREAWRSLIDGWLLRRADTADGVTLEFHAEPGVARAARELDALEAECCAWMAIDVRESDVVTMRVTSSELAGPETIQRMFGPGQEAGPGRPED